MTKQQLEAIDFLDDSQILDDEITSEDAILAELGEMGLDPEQVMARGRRVAERASAQASSWRSVASARRDRWRALAESRRAPSARSRRASMNREELLVELEAARRRPGVGRRVAAYFRGRDPVLANEEELRGMLDDLDLLSTLEEE